MEPLIHRLTRTETPIEPCDVIKWLTGGKTPRVYWASRDGNFEMAGIGSVLFLQPDPKEWQAALDWIQNVLLESDPRITVLSGIRFNTQGPIAPEWQAFGSSFFMVPQVEIRRSHDKWVLASNRFLSSRDSFPGSKPLQAFGAWTPGTSPGMTTTPEFNKWCQSVNRALDSLSQNQLDKVVLAARRTYLFSNPVNALALFDNVARASPNNTFRFFIDQGEGAFLGASPELLFQRDGQTLHCEALAGTTKRGLTQVEDDALGLAMQTDEKTLNEHRKVRDFVVRSLRQVDSDARETECEVVIKLPHLQHLRTSYRAFAGPSFSESSFVAGLHPTPAVLGFPKAEAFGFISQNEVFDRGYYAGALGCVSRDQSEWCVALRSALVYKDCIHAYAGAGLVPGSKPDEEWLEIEAKWQTIHRAIDSLQHSSIASGVT